MPFRAILGGFAARHPDVLRGVIFCDDEGERVESLILDASLAAFDLDIAGASFASIIPRLSASDPNNLVRIAFDGNVTWVRLLRDGYYVLAITRRGTGLENALSSTFADLADAISAHM